MQVSIFLALLVLFGIIYIFLIAGYTYGWFRLKSFIAPTNKQFQTKVTVIIPARNEENNIQHILTDLIRQEDVDRSAFEIIVVDDQSTDSTYQIVEEFIADHKDFAISLIGLCKENAGNTFKKKAIKLAIEKSKGDLIITTDADCRIPEHWLSAILSFYEKEKPKMIVGPVSFHKESSFFEKLQTIEFASLIAITGGAIRIRRPIMCNGANLAYQKEAFIKAGGFGDDRFSSGDDVFLLLKIRKLFGNDSIRFLKNIDSVVYTEAQKSLKSFIHQRTRWASKNKGYDLNILFVSFSVYMVNLLLIGGVILSLFYPQLRNLMVYTFLFKGMIDLPILIGIFQFFDRKHLLLLALPLVPLYPVYIVFTGALGIISSYHWKGRKVKI